MIYELEPEHDDDSYSVSNDSRHITAAAYLKGLHHHDQPTELMPKDAIFLKAARHFYKGLSEEDQNIIDSFADYHLLENMNLKKRNKRFYELTESFICQMGMESKHYRVLPHERRKEEKTNEHD